MADYDYLKAGSGSGNPVLMHITVDRAISATTLHVDAVTNVPTKFIAASGTLLPTGTIDMTTLTEFKGHIDTGNLIIDAFEPGSTDTGHRAGQVVVIKPSTGWANRIAAFIQNATNNGTPEDVTFATMKAANAKITTAITDSNDNEVIKTPATASAVNEVTVTNAASGNAPKISATGDNTNIDLKLQGKGTGGVLPLNPYRFFAYQTAAYTWANGNPAKMPFQTELFDTNNMFDSTTNYRFTAPVTGYYHITLQVGIVINAGNAATTLLYKNGSKFLASQEGTGTGTTIATPNISTIVSLTAGDYLEGWAVNSFGSGGGSQASPSGPDIYTFFSGYLVSV